MIPDGYFGSVWVARPHPAPHAVHGYLPRSEAVARCDPSHAHTKQWVIVWDDDDRAHWLSCHQIFLTQPEAQAGAEALLALDVLAGL